jgi:hypothetical protein
MALPRTPIAYYPLGGSAGAFQTPANNNDKWLIENNAIGDYVFDNIVSSRIFTPINVSNLTNVTQSVWFKTSTNAQLNKYIFFVGQYGTFVLQLNGTNTLRAGVTVNPLTQTYPSLTFNYADGKWHQYIMNYDGSHIKLYIDGVLRIKTARTGTLRDEPTYFTTIGNVNGTANAGAIGEYSNFVAYEHTLTDGGVAIDSAATGEIATLYNYGSPIRTLASIPQSSNLKAWYKLDASEIYNSSSTEWSVDNNQNPSAYQSSLDFVSSESDYITVSNSTALSSYSISCWVNARTLSSYGRLVSLDSVNHRFLGLHSDGTLISGYASPGWNQLFTTSTINTDTWNHIVLVDNGTNTKIYVNTVENTLSNSIAVDGPNYYIGSYGGSQNFFDGKLSNVSIWNTALTSAQITEIYNNGTPSSLSSHSATSNLVSWYKLNNTTTGIQDSKGSNNGTNNGATEYPGFVNALAGESSGMTQANLVQSDLQTVAPYSKYAMKLDDATLSDYINVPNNSTLQITGNLTLSSWVRIDGSYISNGHLIAKQDSYVLKSHQSSLSNKPRFQVNDGSFHNLEGPSALSLDTWHHITGVREGNSLKLYVNGALVASSTPTIGNLSVNTHPVQFNAYTSAYSSDLSLSNNAIWNVALNASEIREIYNEGLPSNLNTFSGTAPISWWQLGENSSFDGSNWKYADEMSAGNNADSVNTAETALTNGVGTTANGTSTGMAVGALVGDAPYSTANAVSSGMSVVSRVSGVSDATITTGGTGYSTGTNTVKKN